MKLEIRTMNSLHVCIEIFILCNSTLTDVGTDVR